MSNDSIRPKASDPANGGKVPWLSLARLVALCDAAQPIDGKERTAARAAALSAVLQELRFRKEEAGLTFGVFVRV